MNLIACVVLAPILGLFIPSRRIVGVVLVAAWACILAPEAHEVLLVQQVDKRSMWNTLTFFAVNYVILVVAVAAADWIWRRRHTRKSADPLEPAR